MHEVPGTVAPDKRQCVIVVSGLLKALNSENYLLRDVLGKHLKSTLHMDKDVRGVKTCLQGMGRPSKLWSGTRGRCFIVSRKIEVYHVNVVRADPKGRVRLWEVVNFIALTLSTHIVEATMLGATLMAVAQWCQEHAIQSQYVVLCSDNLVAVQDLQRGT